MHLVEMIGCVAFEPTTNGPKGRNGRLRQTPAHFQKHPTAPVLVTAWVSSTRRQELVCITVIVDWNEVLDPLK